jgi:hypothetical protein
LINQLWIFTLLIPPPFIFPRRTTFPPASPPHTILPSKLVQIAQVDLLNYQHLAIIAAADDMHPSASRVSRTIAAPALTVASLALKIPNLFPTLLPVVHLDFHLAEHLSSLNLIVMVAVSALANTQR